MSPSLTDVHPVRSYAVVIRSLAERRGRTVARCDANRVTVILDAYTAEDAVVQALVELNAGDDPQTRLTQVDVVGVTPHGYQPRYSV